MHTIKPGIRLNLTHGYYFYLPNLKFLCVFGVVIRLWLTEEKMIPKLKYRQQIICHSLNSKHNANNNSDHEKWDKNSKSNGHWTESQLSISDCRLAN